MRKNTTTEGRAPEYPELKNVDFTLHPFKETPKKDIVYFLRWSKVDLTGQVLLLEQMMDEQDETSERLRDQIKGLQTRCDILDLLVKSSDVCLRIIYHHINNYLDGDYGDYGNNQPGRLVKEIETLRREYAKILKDAETRKVKGKNPNVIKELLSGYKLEKHYRNN